MSNEQYEKGYQKYESKAKEYMEDKEKAEDLLNDALVKAKDKKGALAEVWDKFMLLLNLFKSWTKGEYKEVPKGSIIMIIATIIYFVSPIDIVPDFIAGLGILDDAAVIGFAIKQISSDLEKFKLWKESTEE